MGFASPFPDVDIPEVSVFDMLFRDIGRTDLDRIALVDAVGGARTTYRELIERVNSTAGALAARGIGVGAVVGLLAPNSSLFAVAFHGILRAGATATTINALFTARDIAKQLTDAHATTLITVSALLPQAQEAARTVGIAPERLIVLDGGGETATGHPNADDLLAPGTPAPQVDFDPATHLAVLPYSSGTTGNPKGVMLTHQNLVANMAQIRPLLAIRSDDKILAVLPFFHIYGMTVLLNAALQARATLVVMPRFDLTAFLDCNPGTPDHLRLRRASGRGGAGQASTGRPVRRVITACHPVRRRAVGRRTRNRRGRAVERAGASGLRHE